MSNVIIAYLCIIYAGVNPIENYKLKLTSVQEIKKKLKTKQTDMQDKDDAWRTEFEEMKKKYEEMQKKRDEKLIYFIGH